MRNDETVQRFSVGLRLDEGYRFDVDFGEGAAPFVMDEAPPLGHGEHPNPTRVLGAAIGNCLAASFLFCMRRSHIEVRDLTVQVDGTLVRNERGRFRIGGISVRLMPDLGPENVARMDRCSELFEDFCIVTQSVRDGIDVEVAIQPLAPVPELAGEAGR